MFEQGTEVVHRVMIFVDCWKFSAFDMSKKARAPGEEQDFDITNIMFHPIFLSSTAIYASEQAPGQQMPLEYCISMQNL